MAAIILGLWSLAIGFTAGILSDRLRHHRDGFGWNEFIENAVVIGYIVGIALIVAGIVWVCTIEMSW